MEMTKLKNGTEEPTPVVAVVRASLKRLLDDMASGGPIAAYELVQVCRKPGHKPFGHTGKLLRDFSLLNDDGCVHDSIRNVVLSAARGDGLDMEFVDPAA